MSRVVCEPEEVVFFGVMVTPHPPAHVSRTRYTGRFCSASMSMSHAKLPAAWMDAYFRKSTQALISKCSTLNSLSIFSVATFPMIPPFHIIPGRVAPRHPKHEQRLDQTDRFNQHLNSGHFPASAIRELVSALTKPQFPSTYNLQGSYVDCSAAFISKV